MKYCSNCHHFSKDDDFCSHCGSAVYDDNSESNIECSQIPGHSHEKQSFSGSDSSSYREIENPRTRTSSAPTEKKKGSGCIIFIIIVIVINAFVKAIGGWEALFDILERLFEEEF